MRKFLAFALCAILVISSMAVSASADETENVASGNSYRDEFIGALLNEEEVWVKPNNENYYEMQFIDLNFDGKKEFVVQYHASGNVHGGSDIYSLDNGSVRKLEYDNSDIIVQTENLKGYYDSTTDSYKMIGSYEKSAGFIGDVYYYNFKLIYNPDNQSLNTEVYSRYEKKKGASNVIGTTTYYSADDKVITEEEYNSINSAVVSGFSDIDLKFEKEDVREYKTLSNSDKKEKLEWLYGYDNVEPEPNSEPVSKPIPNTDSDKKDDEQNNNTNNNTTTTSTTVKSPQTGAANNYAAILAVVIAGGAAAAFAGFKRREDI